MAARQSAREQLRRLLRVSVIYLPSQFGLMTLNRQIGGFANGASDKSRLRYKMRLTTKVAILAVLTATIMRPVYAMLFPQDDNLRAAFELLIKADAVYDRAIGYAGKRPEEYKAFETLWKAGIDGKDYALKLVRAEAPAARVYGAILLLELDKEAAEGEFP